MTLARTYPHGVPSWVDAEQPDPRSAGRFYGELFGWELETVSPPGAPAYMIARLGGRDAAGLSGVLEREARWNTYVAVKDAGETAARIAAAGGEVVSGPIDVGRAGRTATCRDPAGAEFRIWEARARLGAQVVNEPGAWNFSDLHMDAAAGSSFYENVFGWEVEDLGFAKLIRVPGYGDHLTATVDPGIRARQQDVAAPPGFEDAVAWVAELEPEGTPHWHVTFAVADRDQLVATAQALGAEILSVAENQWTRSALIRDPQGAVFTASQFTPPS